jgi:class 3 adenylate cyclase
MMAVFGAPMALEDHAVRACLATLGIQEETAGLAADVKDRDGVDLQLRLRLNSEIENCCATRRIVSAVATRGG